MKKLGNTLNNTYDRILVGVFVLLLLLSCYMAYDTWYVRYVSAGSDYNAYKPSLDNPDAYNELSDECIGWITLDRTSIDYPIMQAKDNNKYLNTNPYGEYSLAGSIFLDYKNSPDFSDPFSLVYGHHMSMRQSVFLQNRNDESYDIAKDPGRNSMFGALDLFNELEYFNEHTTGTLTAEGKVYNLEIFAFTITDANESIIFDPTNYKGQYEWVQKNNIYFREPLYKDRIVALSTCKDPGTTERTILFCSISEYP